MLTNFRRKLFLNIGITLGTLLLVGFGIIFLGIDAKGNADYIFRTTAALGSRAQVASDLARLREEEKTADPMLTELLRRIPTRDSLLLNFSIYSRNLGLSHNITSNLKFVAEEPRDSFNVSKFDLAAQGDYLSLIRFFSEFDKSPYVINILSFSLVRQGDRYSLSVSGEIMFRT